MSIAEKLTTVAENQQAVYAAGKKAEHDKMWDVIQRNGTTDYAAGNGYFIGRLFTFDNFYPKYDIRPVGDAAYLFYGWTLAYGNVQGSLKQRLEECGVVLDTSQATKITNMFNYNAMDDIPTIDCTGLTTACTSVFANSWEWRTTIEKIIVNETVTFTSWFTNATGLTNITFEGVIGQDIDFSSCEDLTHDSLMSIINHLKDFTGTNTTMTLTIGTANLAKLTDAEKAIATEKGWTLA